MRRLSFAVLVLAIVTCGLSLVRMPGSWAQAPAGTLPGAQAIIDAGRYPSLQAAIDALPIEGGLVRIPPGTFEITSPLIVGRQDVAIEGSTDVFALEDLELEDQAGFAGTGEKRRGVIAAERKYLLERLQVPVRFLGIGEAAPFANFRSRRSDDLIDPDVDLSAGRIGECGDGSSELCRRNIL